MVLNKLDFSASCLVRGSSGDSRVSFAKQSRSESQVHRVSEFSRKPTNKSFKNQCFANCRDRFGGSALDDAVRHGHKSIQVIEFRPFSTGNTEVASQLISIVCRAEPTEKQRGEP